MDTRPGPGRPTIRTPDQRLRVFVSSTLKELAPERAAVRRAVERLAATPVMFELGARPHPPRDLYRAYLEQSDIFVGIYGDSYGWVAPGEAVSGLEDEYLLVPASMPRLIYIRESAGGREERLEGLIDRIRKDDLSSYKSFRDPAELGRLAVADLAVLFAERFDLSRTLADSASEQPASAAVPGPVSALPNPLTQLVGREADVASVYRLVTSGETRLVTLTGPGGVGKTRLAIEVARRFDRESPGGATFIALAAADSPSTVASTIAQGLGILDTGDLPLEQKLAASVASREGLVVLDNFEQVVEVAPVVVAMLEAAPGLRFLVTSRVLLRVLGESNFPVRPLELPDRGAAAWQPRGPVAPAVELFVERARAVVPDFEVTPENADAVGRIVAALDGLPLAIELAAARTGLLSPAALLERLDRQLSVLVGGRRDAPARHQTVRNAIEWSTDLLTDEERILLWQLGVFAGPSSLGAVEAVASVGADGGDVLALVGALVDASLVRQQERHGRPYLSLLATVREYALERLEASGQLAAARSRHAHYYARWAVRQHADLLGPGQRERLAELTDEGDNLRAATQQMVEAHDWDSLAELSFALYPYWWLVGLLGEVRDRLDELLRSGDPVSDRATAIALWLVAIITYFAGGQASTESLERSARLFASVGDLVGEGNALTTLGLTYETADPPDLVRARQTLDLALGLLHESGDVWSETVALIPMGRLYVAEGDLAGATAQFARALQLGEEQENDFAIALALNGLGWVTLFTGQVVEAAFLMERALDLTIGLSYEHGIAYQLESLLAVAGMLGDVERAGLLAGAAQALRERIGLFNPSDAVLHLPVVEQIRNGPGVQVYERSVEEGRHLSLDAAISVARAVSAAAAAAGAGG